MAIHQLQQVGGRRYTGETRSVLRLNLAERLIGLLAQRSLSSGIVCTLTGGREKGRNVNSYAMNRHFEEIKHQLHVSETDSSSID